MMNQSAEELSTTKHRFRDQELQIDKGSGDPNFNNSYK